MGVTAQQPLQCGVQVEGQLCMVRVPGVGKRAYHYQATGGKQRQAFPYEMPELALDPIPLYGAADRLAYDETRTCRGSALPRHMRVGGVATQMDDQQRAARPASTAYGRSEILAPPQPILGGQHDIRPEAIRRTGGRGPWRDGSRGSRDRRAYASADGSRGSWHDGGCSAGKCACSLRGSRRVSDPAGRRLAVTVRPRKARGPNGSPLDDRPAVRTPEDPRPSVGRRQQPSTTRPRYGTCG